MGLHLAFSTAYAREQNQLPVSITTVNAVAVYLLLSDPEGQKENFQSTVPSVQEMYLPEAPNARFHLKRDGNKGRQEGLLCFFADNSPGRPDHGQWSELGKRRPP